MKKIQSLIMVLAVVVKWAGVAMIVIETIEFGYKRLKEKLGEMENEAPEPSKIENNG